MNMLARAADSITTVGGTVQPLKAAQRVLVVIPAFNEERTVAGVVFGIRNFVNWDVLVVDDESTDATADEARSAGAVVLTLLANTGAWGGIKGILNL